MAEYIDRILLGEAVSHGMVHYEDIMSMPTADVVERKHGKWKRRIVDNGFNADWKCSECGYKVMLDFVGFNFCPNCGADMREESEDIPMEYFESGGN